MSRSPSRKSNLKRKKKEEPQHKCCVDSFSAPTNIVPKNVSRPRAGVRNASMQFDMDAVFKNEPLPSPKPLPCQCICCEYRQDVKGYFKYNGRKLTHMLAGGQTMSETQWREDGKTVGGTDSHYGHRAETPRALIDRYTPRRIDGCVYKGRDRPGLGGGSGVDFEINLQFRGRIIDVCSGATVQTKTWSFKMKGILSRRSRFWT